MHELRQAEKRDFRGSIYPWPLRQTFSKDTGNDKEYRKGILKSNGRSARLNQKSLLFLGS